MEHIAYTVVPGLFSVFSIRFSKAVTYPYSICVVASR